METCQHTKPQGEHIRPFTGRYIGPGRPGTGTLISAGSIRKGNVFFEMYHCKEEEEVTVAIFQRDKEGSMYSMSYALPEKALSDLVEVLKTDRYKKIVVS